jgi:hypothetical protein
VELWIQAANLFPLRSKWRSDWVVAEVNMTDSTPDNLSAREGSTSTVSGGIQADTQGGDLDVGGDVVGRDKIESAGGHIIHAAAGATVIIGASSETAQIPRPIKPARLFISYKRNSDPDQQLANALYEILTRNGHQVFMDTTMRTGEAWLEEIDRQLKASDFLIVLLSRQSADSEMVGAEVRRAYKYRKLQGRPQSLPVRVAYEGLLPYPIDAFLNPLQYVVWQSDADTARVCGEIQQAIAGQLPDQTPIQIQLGPDRLAVSDDGRFIADKTAMQPPLPEFDPRFLKELEAPGGAVKLSDKLYVEREADARLKEQLTKLGTTTTIRAPRQTGKTSLLMRGMQHARSHGQAVVFFDVQGSGRERLASSEMFLRGMAEAISDELALDEPLLEQAWQGTRGASVKLQRFLEKQVLPSLDKPLVLAIDEADGLLQSNFYTDFFSLLRSWHNRRATNPEWEKFNLVLVISTEPYLLIADVNQSPFNVGLHLGLSDFTVEQVRDLNLRHGSPVGANDLAMLMNLLQGHPYLTRRALYALTAEGMSWAQFVREAPTDQGSFSDHLRRQYWNVRDKPELQQALKEILNTRRCSDEMSRFRLLKAGLIKGVNDNYVCRCGLYELYFRDKLQ